MPLHETRSGIFVSATRNPKFLPSKFSSSEMFRREIFFSTISSNDAQKVFHAN
jgi:hypothetical protein